MNDTLYEILNGIATAVLMAGFFLAILAVIVVLGWRDGSIDPNSPDAFTHGLKTVISMLP